MLRHGVGMSLLWSASSIAVPGWRVRVGAN